MLPQKYSGASFLQCYKPQATSYNVVTFREDVVAGADGVRGPQRGALRLVDGERVDDILADLVLDAAVAGLGSNAG